MTAPTVAARPRPRVLDGQGSELGPVANFGAYVFLIVSFIFLFQVIRPRYLPEALPGVIAPGMLVGAFGVLLLAPRWVARRIPVSLLVLVMLGWIWASSIWTDDATGTSIALRRDLPILFGLLIIVGTVSLRHLVRALIWAFRIGAVISMAAVIALPDARRHVDPEGEIADLDGWHGLFPHKTIMASFLLFGMLTILTFDRNRLAKWPMLALIAVLMLGSDSVTGLAAMMLAFSVWVWLQLYQNLDTRNSSVFAITTISMGFFGLVGIGYSIASIIGASGRDLTLTGRTFIWSGVYDLVKERPLVGWGYGGIFTQDPVSPATAELWRAIGFKAAHAHNGFLDVAIQLGFIGVVIFALLFVTTFAGGVNLLRERPKIGAWIVSTLVLQLFTSLSENAWTGYGWLAIVIMLRIVSMRRVGMELETGTALTEHLDRLNLGRAARPGTARIARTASR